MRARGQRRFPGRRFPANASSRGPRAPPSRTRGPARFAAAASRRALPSSRRRRRRRHFLVFERRRRRSEDPPRRRRSTPWPVSSRRRVCSRRRRVCSRRLARPAGRGPRSNPKRARASRARLGAKSFVVHRRRRRRGRRARRARARVLAAPPKTYAASFARPARPRPRRQRARPRFPRAPRASSTPARAGQYRRRPGQLLAVERAVRDPHLRRRAFGAVHHPRAVVVPGRRRRASRRHRAPREHRRDGVERGGDGARGERGDGGFRRRVLRALQPRLHGAHRHHVAPVRGQPRRVVDGAVASGPGLHRAAGGEEVDDVGQTAQAERLQSGARAGPVFVFVFGRRNPSGDTAAPPRWTGRSTRRLGRTRGTRARTPRRSR